ncbi:unnamed protein product [Pleuronectes platessa]|uniref:Uncharacterized protein n=1 Tax=Pleuronectes platessa TaxID=8262 RepID=A0A9N7TNZ0_PLEPL|nr:unnamed protein product [Pleuronectes platessa]
MQPDSISGVLAQEEEPEEERHLHSSNMSLILSLGQWRHTLATCPRLPTEISTAVPKEEAYCRLPNKSPGNCSQSLGNRPNSPFVKKLAAATSTAVGSGTESPEL